MPAQDAEWFEAKQSKRKGGGQSNGIPSRQPPTEVNKEDEFEVRAQESIPGDARCCGVLMPLLQD